MFPISILYAQVFFMTFVTVFFKAALMVLRFHKNHYSHANLPLKMSGFLR